MSEEKMELMVETERKKKISRDIAILLFNEKLKEKVETLEIG